MSEADSNKADLSRFFSPGILVLFVGVIGYLLSEPPLLSNRPESASRQNMPPPPSPPGLSAVHARLWDDPLEVAYDDHERARPRTVWEQLASRATEDHEPARPAWDFRPIIEEITERNSEPAEHSKLAGRVLCLPVLVPGEPYDDDAEQRRRITYAVLSALWACDYELTYADRVSYVTMSIRVVDPASKKAIDTELVVPVKLFQRLHRPDKPSGTDGSAQNAGEPDVPEGVFVCWINEALLGGRPLAAIGQIVDQLFLHSGEKSEGGDAKESLALHILGPTNSDDLLEMAQENAEWDASEKLLRDVSGKAAGPKGLSYFSQFADATLYSGMATVSSSSIAAFEADSRPAQMLDDFASGGQTTCGLRVIRTIGTDELLVRLIARELWLRGAWPGRNDPLGAAASQEAKATGKYIVLVTEFDTLFGRTLPPTFRHAFPLVLRRTSREREDDVLQVFRYLRGLDGKLPRTRPAEQDAGNKPQSEQTPQLDMLRTGEPETIPPYGMSQFDYIRRLESYLVEFHERKRSRGEYGIAAVGVMGSDVYDKLLLLRALRGRFPAACFFTTDCDAALSLEREYPTTRNVVVASHFALQLNPDLQRGTPVFRDSYQTATYFQCLLALGDSRIPKDLQEDPWRTVVDGKPSICRLEPLMFEVARHGLYQITLPSGGPGGNAVVHPPSPRQGKRILGAQGLLFALLATICFAWCLSRLVTPFRAAFWQCMLGLLVLAALLAVALLDGRRADGEPLELFEGISVWPPIMIRMLAFMLAAGFLHKAGVDLDAIGSKHDKLLLSPDERGRLTSDSERPRNVTEWLRRDVIVSSWPEEPRAATELYREYRLRGRRRYRFLRSGTMSASYVLFGACLMRFSTSSPSSPMRGLVASFSGTMVLFLAVLSMVVLTFYCYDAMQLARKFVKYVAVRRPDWATGAAGMTAIEHDRRPVVEDDARELLTVQLIAEQTQVVGKLVTYPFWVVFLVILSRHPSFDFFDFPFALLILWGLTLAGAVLFAGSLRWAATQAREELLTRLRNALASSLVSADDASSRRAEQLRHFMADVKREQRGAFRPFAQDPIITALATLMGGTGGIMLVEQLLPYK